MTPITQAPFAAIQAAASDGRTKAILYMPAGRWQITPWIGGQPAPLDVLVEPKAAEAIEQQRRIQATGGARAFFSPSHQSSQPWFDVDGFAWETRADKSGQRHTGVWASGSFTEAGTRGMAAQVFPYFSPEFFVDNLAGKPARVITNPKARANMGGFVDQPAFPMPPVQAAGADTSAPAAAGSVSSSNATNQKPNTDPMKKSWLLLDPTPADGGTAAPPPTPVQTARAGDFQSPPAPPAAPAVQASASPAELAELNRLRDEDKARREREADAAVQACCAKGIIPIKDDAAKAQWRADFVANPALAARMTALPAALPQGRIVQAGRADVQITGEDIKHAVQAYHAATTPQARAALWATDIRSRFKPEFERAIQAANSLGGLAGDLIIQQALDNILYQFPLLSRISTDFSGANAQFNQTIKTRLRTQRTAQDYDAATGYVAGDATHTDVDVVINKHKFDMVTFSVTELAKTRRDLFGEEEEGMLYAVAKAMVDDLYALITTANFTNTPTTKALVDFGRDTVVDMKVALNTAKVFGGVRTLLLNSSYHGALEKDTVVVSNLSNPNAAQVFGQSRLPVMAEFSPFEAGNLPTTGNLTGFGFRADALAMASRLPNDYTDAIAGLPSTGVVTTIMHPEAGLALQKVAYVNHQMGNASARVALMYGVAKGRVVAGQILRSAA